MDVWQDLGKAVAQGVAQGIDNYQKQKNQQQAELQNFSANEHDIRNAAENGDLDAVQYLTIMYYKQGDYQNAAYWGRKGAAVDDDTCLYMMGEIAFACEDYKSAANFWTRNINVNGDSLSATCLGNLYLNADDYSNAEYYFDFALSRDNSNTEAALGMALCKLNGDNPDLNQIEQLLQVASRSELFSTRDAAKQILQQIREAKTQQPPQQNDGCFITTAVCGSFGKSDDCFELTAFRKFRDGWLTAQPDGKSLIAEYYAIAPKIVAKINRLPDAAQIYQTIWQRYLAPCLQFINRGENSACKNKYIEMVRELKARYF